MSAPGEIRSCPNCHACREETELYYDDEGRPCKRCRACGHEWGPFVSTDLGEPESGQMDLADFC